MKCWFCLRAVSGNDMKHRVEWRRQSDGGLLVLGEGQPDGNLAPFMGTLERVYHRKCHLASIRREALQAAKGDDPVQQSPDWRDQEVVEVGDIGASDGDCGGAGAAHQ